MNTGVTLFPFAEYWSFYLGFLLLVFVLLAVDLGVFHRERPRGLDPRGGGLERRLGDAWRCVQRRLLLLHAVALPARPAADGGARLRPRGRGARDGARVPGRLRRRVLALDRQHLRLRGGARPTSPCPRPTSTGCSSSASWARSISRGIFIALGAALLQFEWVVWLFGAFLVFTGAKMMTGGGGGSGRASRAGGDPAVPQVRAGDRRLPRAELLRAARQRAAARDAAVHRAAVPRDDRHRLRRRLGAGDLRPDARAASSSSPRTSSRSWACATCTSCWRGPWTSSTSSSTASASCWCSSGSR